MAHEMDLRTPSPNQTPREPSACATEDTASPARLLGPPDYSPSSRSASPKPGLRRGTSIGAYLWNKTTSVYHGYRGFRNGVAVDGPGGNEWVRFDFLRRSKQSNLRLKQALNAADVFYPDSTWRWAWDFVLYLGLLWYGISTPLLLADNSSYPTDAWLPLDAACLFVYLCDIPVHARSAYVHAFQLEIRGPVILKRYFSRYFLLDFVACFPLDLILRFAFHASPSVVAGTRVLHLAKHACAIRLFATTFRSNMSPYYVQFRCFVVPMLRILLAMVHFVHCVAVGWMAVSAKFTEGNVADRYLLALYWTLYTIAGIGFGDIPVIDNAQRVYCCVLFIFGALVNGLIIGKLSSMFLTTDSRDDTMRHTLELLQQNEVPEDLQREVLAFQHYKLAHNISAAHAALIEGLPEHMRVQIGLYIKIKFISLVGMFANASPECKIALAQSLKTVTYAPEEFIIRFGEHAHAMFFIGHGFCDVFSDQEECLATLRKGAFFGEIALLMETHRTASVKALTYCNLFRLDRVDFLAILEQFPDFKQLIRAEIIKRSDAELNNRSMRKTSSMYSHLEEITNNELSEPATARPGTETGLNSSLRARIDEIMPETPASSFTHVARQATVVRKATAQWVGFVQRVRMNKAVDTASGEAADSGDVTETVEPAESTPDRSFLVEEIVRGSIMTAASPRSAGRRGSATAAVSEKAILEAVRQAQAQTQAQLQAQAQRFEAVLQAQQAAIAELTRALASVLPGVPLAAQPSLLLGSEDNVSASIVEPLSQPPAAHVTRFRTPMISSLHIISP